jgi:hypothetical protein
MKISKERIWNIHVLHSNIGAITTDEDKLMCYSEISVVGLWYVRVKNSSIGEGRSRGRLPLATFLVLAMWSEILRNAVPLITNLQVEVSVLSGSEF